MTKNNSPDQAQKRQRARQVLSDLSKMVTGKVPLDDIHREEGRVDSGVFSNADLDFLARLASPSPAPAGGSAAAYTAAMSAALITMCARITADNPKHAAVHPQMIEVIRQSESLERAFVLAAAADESAYQEYLAARRLSAGTPDEQQFKESAIQRARVETIQLPLEIAGKCLDLLHLALLCVSNSSFPTIPDIRTASFLAESALKACDNNILFNLRKSTDEAYNVGVRDARKSLLKQMQNRLEEIQEQYNLRIEKSSG